MTDDVGPLLTEARQRRVNTVKLYYFPVTLPALTVVGREIERAGSKECVCSVKSYKGGQASEFSKSHVKVDM